MLAKAKFSVVRKTN